MCCRDVRVGVVCLHLGTRGLECLGAVSTQLRHLFGRCTARDIGGVLVRLVILIAYVVMYT